MSVKSLCKAKAKKLGVTHVTVDEGGQLTANAPGGKHFQVKTQKGPVALACVKAHSWAALYAVLEKAKVVPAA